jgi:hypothetical protein
MRSKRSESVISIEAVGWIKDEGRIHHKKIELFAVSEVQRHAWLTTNWEYSPIFVLFVALCED